MFLAFLRWWFYYRLMWIIKRLTIVVQLYDTTRRWLNGTVKQGQTDVTWNSLWWWRRRDMKKLGLYYPSNFYLIWPGKCQCRAELGEGGSLTRIFTTCIHHVRHKEMVVFIFCITLGFFRILILLVSLPLLLLLHLFMPVTHRLLALSILHFIPFG